MVFHQKKKKCVFPSPSLVGIKAGFTLIELLVVISIIGILASLLLVSYQGTKKTARDGKRKADLEQIRSALEMYRADRGSYPSSRSLAGCNYWAYVDQLQSTLVPNYIAELPKDPLEKRTCLWADTSAQTYMYFSYPYAPCGLQEGVHYILATRLEAGGCKQGRVGTCDPWPGASYCVYFVTNP